MNPATTQAEAAERRELITVAHELSAQELAPRSLELDERRPDALQAAWGYVTDIGFDRAILPVEYDGSGLDSGSLLFCLEEIAAGDAGIAMRVLLANAALAAMPPGAATPGPGERWALVPAATGATTAGVSIAEEEGRFTADGLLSPALGASGVDGVVVILPDPDAAVFSLPLTAEGLRAEELEPQLGLRAAAAARLSLTEVAVELAGDEESHFASSASMSLLQSGTAAIARGVARQAYELALDYAENRIQGGVTIVMHDAVREMLAAMAVRLAAVPSPVHALAEGEAGALTARIAAADAAVQTTTDAVQVFGGTGYMHETGVEKLMRDAKWLQLWPRATWVDRDSLLELLR